MPRPAVEDFRLVIEALLERPTVGTYALAITRATHLPNATAGAVLRQLEQRGCIREAERYGTQRRYVLTATGSETALRALKDEQILVELMRRDTPVAPAQGRASPRSRS